MRIAPLEAKRRFHEAAMDGVPEHLVEYAEIECRRVESPVPDERQRTKYGDVHEDHRERDPSLVSLEPRPEIGARYVRRVLDGGRRLHGAILTVGDAFVRRTLIDQHGRA